MRKIKLLLIAVLALLTSTVFAEETYYDMPVQINVSGGCTLTTPTYSTTTTGSFAANAETFLTDYSFTVNCVNGVNYEVRFNPSGGSYIDLNDSNNNKIKAKFFKTDKTTDITNDGLILSGTGTGQDQQVTISPAISTRATVGTVYTCNDSICTVPSATYSANVTIKVIW